MVISPPGRMIDDALLRYLDDLVTPDLRILVIDAYVSALAEGNRGGKNAQEIDAEKLAPLHLFSKRHPDLATVMLHHTSRDKNRRGADRFAGSNQILGKCDWMIVLTETTPTLYTVNARGRLAPAFEERWGKAGLGHPMWTVARTEPELTIPDARRRVYELVREHGPIGTKALAHLFGRSESTTSCHASLLLESGHLEKNPEGLWVHKNE